jgi:hypothetical protein
MMMMPKFRFRVVAVLSILIIPTISFCLAGKPKPTRRANPPEAKQAAKVAPAPEMSEADKLEWAMDRSRMNRAGYAGRIPANSQPNCANVVTNVFGDEGVAPSGNYWMNVAYDWACTTATSQSPCRTVGVVTIFNGSGEWQVFHQDSNPLACGDNMYEIDRWSLNVDFQPPPNGNYTANIDVYRGSWATWTPSSPVLGTGEFSFAVSH